jgi:hypothetical protein
MLMCNSLIRLSVHSPRPQGREPPHHLQRTYQDDGLWLCSYRREERGGDEEDELLWDGRVHESRDSDGARVRFADGRVLVGYHRTSILHPGLVSAYIAHELTVWSPSVVLSLPRS